MLFVVLPGGLPGPLLSSCDCPPSVVPLVAVVVVVVVAVDEFAELVWSDFLLLRKIVPGSEKEEGIV
jgi:hypothetical protein